MNEISFESPMKDTEEVFGGRRCEVNEVLNFHIFLLLPVALQPAGLPQQPSETPNLPNSLNYLRIIIALWKRLNPKKKVEI